MLLDAGAPALRSALQPAPRLRPVPRVAPSYRRVDSEYGTLRSVLLADPRHLALVPCNAVSEQSIAEGRAPCSERSVRQHAGLVGALRSEGVEVRLVPADTGLPDLAFTRDTSLMTPWGLLGLLPGAAHRVREVDAVLAAAGGPSIGRIERGRAEGGDVHMIRPGTLVIGISGDRTDEAGAAALGDIYRRHGWDVIPYRFDPVHLHLDTLFCTVDRNLAVACIDMLEPDFVRRIEALGIELLPVSHRDARRLGCNLLSLGNKRVVTAGTCSSVDAALAVRGYRSIAVDLSEFTMCGGGVHCLTMPLKRDPA